MLAPDPWISVLPTFTDTGRLVQLEKLDSDSVCTIILLGTWTVRLCRCVTDDFLGGAACERVRCAMGRVHTSVAGCAGVPVVAVHGRCISGGLCSTGAATTSFRVTMGVPFHTCVRSSVVGVTRVSPQVVGLRVQEALFACLPVHLRPKGAFLLLHTDHVVRWTLR